MALITNKEIGPLQTSEKRQDCVQHIALRSSAPGTLFPCTDTRSGEERRGEGRHLVIVFMKLRSDILVESVWLICCHVFELVLR